MCVLETARLWLKPTQEYDIDTFHNVLANPFVRKYLCDNQLFSRDKAAEILIESVKLFAEHQFGLWLIELKPTNAQNTEVIGFVGLWYFFGEPQPQLVYALLPHWTKQGFATEAAERVMRYCFETLNFGYLVASCDYLNLDSQKLAIKLEMAEVENRQIDGQPILFFLAQNPKAK